MQDTNKGTADWPGMPNTATRKLNKIIDFKRATKD